MKEEKVYNTKEGFPIPPDHIPSVEDMERLANGDRTVLPVLIEGLIGFVNGVLDAYISKMDAAKPYKEDLTSEALLTLCTFVEDKLGQSLEPTRLMMVLSGAVKNNTTHWLRENTNTITIPRTSQIRLGIELVRHPLREDHATTRGSEVFDHMCMEEFIGNLIPIQEEVVRLRMKDFSERKISEKIGLHRGVVSGILDDLKTLYGEV